MEKIEIEDVYAKVCGVEGEIKAMWKLLNHVFSSDKSQNKQLDGDVDNFFDRMADWCLKEATRLKMGK